jgi:muramoyltetrapeptide carboxypeptidase
MTPVRAPLWPRPGQAITLAAPAGAVDPEALAAGQAALAALLPGVEVVAGPELLARAGYLAGTDAERAEFLTRAMLEPGPGAVLAVRAGYGSSRLLPLLDLDALAASRRLLVGFSDLTCLLNALAARGLVTVHGPLLTSLPTLDQTSRDELAALLSGNPPWPARLTGQTLSPGSGPVRGPVRGILLGGNLTLLCHLLGTPWFPELTGAILVLEEVNEPAYRLDRCLTQLRLAGLFDRLAGVAGVALGSLSAQAADPPELTAVAAERLAGLGLPVVMGLPFGHGPANRPLPLGALAELDAAAGALTVGIDLG